MDVAYLNFFRLHTADFLFLETVAKIFLPMKTFNLNMNSKYLSVEPRNLFFKNLLYEILKYVKVKICLKYELMVRILRMFLLK